MSSHLSRKQQKSQAFKAKQKAKKRGEVIPDDVPEQDLVNEDEDDHDEGVASSSKPNVSDKGKSKATAVGDAEDHGAKSVKAKKKAKTAWDEEDGEAKKDKKDIKQRFILFVGNLDFKTTREAIQAHFNDAVGHKPQVRLLTSKPTPKSPAQSRGIAFLELSSSADLQACLKLHQSSLEGRRINVELTAGGGGKGQGRKDKIKERNERVGGQRQRRAEKEAEEGKDGGEEEDMEAGVAHGRGGPDGGRKRKRAEGRNEETVVTDGVKVRGGRRKRVKEGDSKPSDRPRSANGPAQKFPARQSGYSRGGGARGGRQGRPYGLTGANAVNIG